MLDEQQVTVSEAGNLWTLLDAYGAATGADVYRLSWSFGGEALDTESPSGGTTGLVEVGRNSGPLCSSNILTPSTVGDYYGLGCHCRAGGRDYRHLPRSDAEGAAHHCYGLKHLLGALPSVLGR